MRVILDDRLCIDVKIRWAARKINCTPLHVASHTMLASDVGTHFILHSPTCVRYHRPSHVTDIWTSVVSWPVHR